MPFFPVPPATLPPIEQERWQQRLEEAKHLAGVREASVVQVSQTTLELLQRYVSGELTREQLVRLQSQRLSGR